MMSIDQTSSGASRESGLPHTERSTKVGRPEVQDRNQPTVRANKGVRFYNAGDRLNEPIAYSLPGAGDIHAIAKHMVDAPEGDYFWVPTELRLLADGTRIPVDFATTIVQRWGARGVIMVDEDFVEDGDGQTDNIPICTTEEDAKIKGKRLWDHYLEDICKKHINAVQQARAAGGYPREAEGFTKRALKLRGWKDPAEMVLNEMKQTAGASPDLAAVLAQNAALMKQVQEIANTSAKLQAELEATRRDKTLTALADKKKAPKANPTK